VSLFNECFEPIVDALETIMNSGDEAST